MVDVQKQYVSSGGVQIYYEVCRVSPDARVAFLVHGIGGDLDAWKPVRDVLLSRGISTVALDLRGHGYSDHPTRKEAYAVHLAGDDVLAVLNAEHLDSVILIGHSGGAVLALDFAIRHQGRIAKLILLAGSYCPPWYVRSPLFRALAHAVIAVGSALSLPSPGPWHSPYPKGKFHQEFEIWGLMRTMYHNSLRSYLRTGLWLTDIDLEASLKDVAIPTLLVVGEKDGIYPVSVSEKMHSSIPHSIFTVIPNANHVLPLNNAPQVADLITRFIGDTPVIL